MNVYTGAGVLLLAAASLVLIGSAIYLEHALRNPASILFPFPNTVAITPAVGPAPVAAVVVLEHLLVGSGLWCLRRGARGRAKAPTA